MAGLGAPPGRRLGEQPRHRRPPPGRPHQHRRRSTPHRPRLPQAPGRPRPHRMNPDRS
jgi:hypothetical protein